MSWVCSTDVSLAYTSPNPTQNSDITVHTSLSPEKESEKKQAAAPRVHIFF